MKRWYTKLDKLNKQACLVISYEGENVTCASLYAKDSVSYETFNGNVKAAAETCNGKNKDPSDHEDIHVLFGEVMGVAAEDTKTFSTHFHWVFSDLTLENGFYSFFITLKKSGFIDQATVRNAAETFVA